MRRLLEHPAIYALWQAPFVEQKVAPFRDHNRSQSMGRVLDVGCGPGTNRALFGAAEYLGVDLDPNYVARATQRFGPHFRVGDAGALDVGDFAPVECLFVNSLTHHLNDEVLNRLLARTDLLTPTGRLHLIDMYLPPSGISRRLALADRGEHPRPLSALRDAIARCWAIEIEHPFALHKCGVNLWAMVYFRARPRRLA